MAALFNSLLRALAGVAISTVMVAVIWTIYINRDAISETAAPVVNPIVESASEATR